MEETHSRRRSHSADSIRTDTTWRYSVFGLDRLGKGAVLFTGPDGIKDHQVTVEPEHRYVGETSMPEEGTSEVDYLWRAPSWVPHPRPKSLCVGEIGWGIPFFTDWSAPRTGVQIKLGEFRQAVEDRHSHAFQDAWYPGPGEVLPEGSDAALVMNVYKLDEEGLTLPQPSSSRTNILPPINRQGSAGSNSRGHSQGSRPGSSHSHHSIHSNHSHHSNSNNNNSNNNRGYQGNHRYSSYSYNGY